MPRFAWAIVITALLLLALRLTLFDPGLQSTSCTDLERGFESKDFKESLPDDPALLIGNQRVRHWKTPVGPIRGRKVVRRSAAGLNPELIDQCFPRLVGYYHPSVVIMPLDTPYASNVDPAGLLSALQRILDHRLAYSLDFELWVIAPITTPRYETTEKTSLSALNASGEEWASGKFKVRWLDLQSNFIDGAGNADTKLVWPNGNTLNDRGYQRLTDALIKRSNERK